ncbi:MAG: DUF4260 domain-containing protein [Ferruginibacter sp.]
MKHIIRLEEFAMLLLSIAALYSHHPAWWLYAVMAIGPDISMLGYLAGNKTGAAAYNLFHHKGVAIAIFIFGFTYNIEPLIITGIILFGHSSMDRVFGYGLKYDTGFKFTHLGEIGNKK